MSTHLTALGLTLLHVGWQALVIAALYRLIDLCLTRLGQRARYRLGIAAMLAVLALALATFTYEEIRLAAHPAAATVLTGLPVTSASLQWLPYLDMVWIAGVAVLSLRLAAGLWFIQGLKRAALPVPPVLKARFNALSQRLGLAGKVELRLHPRISGPFVTGIMRSVVYLPLSSVTALTPEQLDAVLSHELEHVLRHDYAWNLLQSAIETLFFFHPAVWWIGNRLREQRELICDDAALAACSDPITYATALLRLEEDRRASLPARLAPNLSMALNGHRNNLFWRIARILDEDTNQSVKSSRLLRAAGAALSLPLAVALLAAFAPPVAQSAATVASKLINAPQPPKTTPNGASTSSEAASEDASDSSQDETPAPRDDATSHPAYVIHADHISTAPDDPAAVAEITRKALIQAQDGLKAAGNIDPDAIANQVRNALRIARTEASKHGGSDIDPDAIAAQARAEAIKAKAEALREATKDIDPDAIAAQVRADLERQKADIQRAKAESLKAKSFAWTHEDSDAPVSGEVPAPVMPVAPPAPAAPAAPTVPAPPAAPKNLSHLARPAAPAKPAAPTVIVKTTIATQFSVSPKSGNAADVHVYPVTVDAASDDANRSNRQPYTITATGNGTYSVAFRTQN